MGVTMGTLAVLKSEMDTLDDAGELAKVLAAVGSFALERLGFVSDQPGDIAIDVGGEDPEEMSVKITWPLPLSHLPTGRAENG